MTAASVIRLNGDSAGHAETCKLGDCLVSPRGMNCPWHRPEITRKTYVIFDAKAQGFKTHAT